MSSTRAASAARLARASENAPDYKTPDDRRKASGHSSGTISHSRTGFASEKRQKRTGVRDWSGERRKARPGKARLRREKGTGLDEEGAARRRAGAQRRQPANSEQSHFLRRQKISIKSKTPDGQIKFARVWSCFLSGLLKARARNGTRDGTRTRTP